MEQVNNEVYELITIEHQIKYLKNQLKELEVLENELKEKILGQMEVEQLRLFENEEIKITKTPEREKIVLDTESLKKDMPEVFEKYATKTIVKGYARITLKGGK